MKLYRRHKLEPPRWVVEAGERVYYGIALFCLATALFGLAMLLFGL